MHLRIYRARPDVRAVVHAHPPVATGFAVAGRDFMDAVLPEVILQLGSVPLVPYATPGTPALADAIEPFLAEHDAFLLANHGATTVGPIAATGAPADGESGARGAHPARGTTLGSRHDCATRT